MSLGGPNGLNFKLRRRGRDTEGGTDEKYLPSCQNKHPGTVREEWSRFSNHFFSFKLTLVLNSKILSPEKASVSRQMTFGLLIILIPQL